MIFLQSLFPVPVFSNFFLLIFVISKATNLNSIPENEDLSVTSTIVTLPTQGKIQGVTWTSRSGRYYLAYLGIPFAEPPKRFKNPEIASSKWDGVRDGSKWGSECIQRSWITGKASGSEDCLFLNVFTPNLTKAFSNRLYSTIVFIHGGGFQGGSGGQYGVENFMDHDIVFVTINYRLSALGFLNTEDGEVDGNVGLKDQTMAMYWVRNNIHVFGGNPENVTIFGGSAGAASVSYHILSSFSKGLFKRAISGSGSAECPWAFVQNPRESAVQLANKLNCPTETSTQMINCLKTKDAGELVDKTFTKFGWNLDTVAPFGPSIEYTFKESSADTIQEIFLSDTPTNLYEEGNFNRVPWLTSVTKNEGLALHSASIMNSPDILNQLNENWDSIAPITFSFKSLFLMENLTLVSEKIRNFYFGGDKFPIKNDQESATRLEQLYSDRNFYHGIRSSILNHAKHNVPVYPFFFDYIGHKSWLETMLGYNITPGSVAHGDDFAYYVNFYLNPTDSKSAQSFQPNSTVEEMSKKLVKLLVSFADYGEIISSWDKMTKWTRTSVAEANGSIPLKWNHINLIPTVESEDITFQNRMQFWTDLLKIGVGEASVVNMSHPEL